MKKIIYITFIFIFLYGCSKQKKSFIKEEVAPVTEDSVVKETFETIDKKNEVTKNDDKTLLEVDKAMTINYKELSRQKINQILDIALLIQKEHVDIDLKEHALDYAKLLFVKKDEQLIKQELNRLKLQNVDSIKIKDLKVIDSQNKTDNNQKLTYNFNVIIFKNGKIFKTINKVAIVEFNNVKTTLNGKSYFNIKTKIVEIK